MLDYYGRVKEIVGPIYAGDAATLRTTLSDSEIRSQINTRARMLGHQTALHFACALGNVDVVQALVEAGSDLSARDSAGRLPLHVAANRGDRPVIDYFLSLKAVDAEMRQATDNNGRTFVHAALCNGHLPGQNKAGKEFVAAVTALIKAHPLLNKEIIQLQDNLGVTPVQYALINGYNIFPDDVMAAAEASTVGLLIKHDYNGRTELQRLAAVGTEDEQADLTRISELLDQDAHPMDPSPLEGYMNAIHLACANRGPEVVALFLNYLRSNPNSVDLDCRNALHVAAHSGREDVVHSLLEYDAILENIAAVDINKRTAMHAAVMSPSESVGPILRALHAHSSDLLQMLDIDGHTPLELARAQNNEAAVVVLTELLAADPANRDCMRQMRECLWSVHEAVTGWRSKGATAANSAEDPAPEAGAEGAAAPGAPAEAEAEQQVEGDAPVAENPAPDAEEDEGEEQKVADPEPANPERVKAAPSLAAG